jgi:hypothetical protein
MAAALLQEYLPEDRSLDSYAGDRLRADYALLEWT